MVSPATRDNHIPRKMCSTVGLFLQPVCREGADALQKISRTFTEFHDGKARVSAEKVQVFCDVYCSSNSLHKIALLQCFQIE